MARRRRRMPARNSKGRFMKKSGSAPKRRRRRRARAHSYAANPPRRRRRRARRLAASVAPRRRRRRRRAYASNPSPRRRRRRSSGRRSYRRNPAGSFGWKNWLLAGAAAVGTLTVTTFVAPMIMPEFMKKSAIWYGVTLGAIGTGIGVGLAAFGYPTLAVGIGFPLFAIGAFVAGSGLAAKVLAPAPTAAAPGPGGSQAPGIATPTGASALTLHQLPTARGNMGMLQAWETGTNMGALIATRNPYQSAFPGMGQTNMGALMALRNPYQSAFPGMGSPFAGMGAVETLVGYHGARPRDYTRVGRDLGAY